jgi:hypothetical protein
MPNMKDWTPEQRAEAVRKSKETRDRKRAEKDARKAGREAAPRRPSPVSKAQVKHALSAVIVGIDGALAYFAPQSWVTPEDRLNEREVEILTEAFSTEAMKSARALRFLAALSNLTGQLGVVGALLLVALPRLTRRGLIPRQWVPVLRDLLGAATAKDVQAPEAFEKAFDNAAPEPPEEPGPDRAAA